MFKRNSEAVEAFNGLRWKRAGKFEERTEHQRSIEEERKITEKRIKNLQSLLRVRRSEFLAWKKRDAALWKRQECIWKRQRPFLYAHNSIRE